MTILHRKKTLLIALRAGNWRKIQSATQRQEIPRRSIQQSPTMKAKQMPLLVPPLEPLMLQLELEPPMHPFERHKLPLEPPMHPFERHKLPLEPPMHLFERHKLPLELRERPILPPERPTIQHVLLACKRQQHAKQRSETQWEGIMVSHLAISWKDHHAQTPWQNGQTSEVRPTGQNPETFE